MSMREKRKNQKAAANGNSRGLCFNNGVPGERFYLLSSVDSRVLVGGFSESTATFGATFAPGRADCILKALGEKHT